MAKRFSILKKSKIAIGLFSSTLLMLIAFQNCGKFSTIQTPGDPLDSLQNLFAADSPSGPLIPDVATIRADQTLRFSQRRATQAGEFKLIAGQGTVDPLTGVFSPSGDGTDAIVGRQDSVGNWSYSFVKVAGPGSAVALSPSAVLLAPGQQIKLSAAGGTPPYSYFLNGLNHASLDRNSGLVTAGDVEESFLVQVMDYAGKMAQSTVTIKKGTYPAMGILSSPNPMIIGKPVTFIVMGGTGPYTLKQDSGFGSLAGQIFSPGFVPGQVSFTVQDAQGQRLQMRSQVIDDPTAAVVYVGNKAFFDPGTYQFVVPPFHSISISVSGGGGGGGGGFYGTAGTTGTGSSFGSVLQASGGTGGSPVASFYATGASGLGGAAKGGSTNTVGGGSPGGTGGSMGYGDRGGTGGGGGFAKIIYDPSQLKSGSTVTIVVGAGGVGGNNYYTGKNSGDGTAGRVIITWY